MIEALISLDKELFLFLNGNLVNPVFDAIFPLITHGRFWIIPGLIAAALFYRKERSRALWVLLFSVLLAAVSDPICVRVLKPLFHRFRPCDPASGLEGVRCLTRVLHSPSFPSAHAFNVFAQAALFTFFYRRRWPFFFAFAALIGFSRIYVGVHFPGDVLGGALMGGALGLAFAAGAQRIRGRHLTIIIFLILTNFGVLIR